MRDCQVPVCLTTNFDNCIELASASWISVKIFPYDQSPPTGVFAPQSNPVLYKLHGDALSESCVATSEHLADLELSGGHRYLRELLRGRTVFVVGYSGLGDIDIFPQLERVEGAKFIWTSRSRRSAVPDFARGVLCDLEDEGQDNALLQICQRQTGQIGKLGHVASRADAKANVSAHVRSVIHKWMELYLSDGWRFIYSLLAWQTAQPPLHLALTRCLANGSRDWILEASAMIQAKAYFTALIWTMIGFRRMPSAGAALNQTAAFAWWRLGYFRQAMRTFEACIQKHDKEGNLHESHVACRSLVEVAEEALRYLGPRQRRALNTDYDLGARLANLRAVPHKNAAEQLLIERATLAIEGHLGCCDAVQRLATLYRKAHNSQYFEIETTCISTMFYLEPSIVSVRSILWQLSNCPSVVSRLNGRHRVRAVTTNALMRAISTCLPSPIISKSAFDIDTCALLVKNCERRHFNYFYKLVFAILDSRLNRVFPKLSGLSFSILAQLKTILMELRMLWWVAKWRLFGESRR